MTGFNIMRGAVHGRDFDLNPHDRDEQWRRESIREYCDQHPLAPYSEAVANLSDELGKPTE